MDELNLPVEPADELVEESVEMQAPLPVEGDEEVASTDEVRKGVAPRIHREPTFKLSATNWLNKISDSKDCNLVQVQFKNTRNSFYDNYLNLDLKPGDMVAVEAAQGHDIGSVLLTGRLVAMQMKKANLRPDFEIKKIFRKAHKGDLEKYAEAKSREHDTMIRARKIAEDLELDMKIGDVEYQGDGGKAIFYYIADERVDFRKLIRVLADTFHVRIEMKQIGARQEAGRIGGIGPCGRPLCCSTWLSHFVSVGTSAARYQDLSMNPQKLAGMCDKLKCCLNYEVDEYIEAQRKLPPRDVVLKAGDNDYYFFKADILGGTVTYSTEKGQPINTVTIDTRRAFDVIAMNKEGAQPEELKVGGNEEKPDTGFFDLTDQDSLTRFDKASKKKKRRSAAQGKKEDSGRGDAKKNPHPETNKNQGKEKERNRDKNQNENREHRQKGHGQQHRQNRKQNRRQNHSENEQ